MLKRASMRSPPCGLAWAPMTENAETPACCWKTVRGKPPEDDAAAKAAAGVMGLLECSVGLMAIGWILLLLLLAM